MIVANQNVLFVVVNAQADAGKICSAVPVEVWNNRMPEISTGHHKINRRNDQQTVVHMENNPLRKDPGRNRNRHTTE